MTSDMRKSSENMNRVRLSRQVKRPSTDRPKILSGEVPESTWVNILNKQEQELMILSVREDIIEMTMDICYQKYMDRQKCTFTAHCAAEAWLEIIDWHFFRHDPGEDSTAYPPADIPNREQSWIPDVIPDPSPKDTWCRHDLEVAGGHEEEVCNCLSSASTTEENQNRCDGETVVLKKSCSNDSNMSETIPCELSTKTRDSGAAASTSSISDLSLLRKMDSSPVVPASSICSGKSSRGSSKPRRPKDIFKQSTSGRSKQTLPPLKKTSKTQR